MAQRKGWESRHHKHISIYDSAAMYLCIVKPSGMIQTKLLTLANAEESTNLMWGVNLSWLFLPILYTFVL